MAEISIRHIVYFLTIAKHGSMTKAAGILHVTQPLLSQKLAQLEQEIGLQLFVRENRQLALTNAGMFLYKKWTKLLKSLDQSIEDAKSLQAEESMHISLGINSGTCPQLIQSLATSLRSTMPEYLIDLRIANLFSLIDQVLVGALDVIVFPNYETENHHPEMLYLEVACFPLLLSIHRSNPVAAKDKLAWSQLKSEKFLITRPSPYKGYERAITEAC